jgi:uncharacterized protein (TIGR04222 family)
VIIADMVGIGELRVDSAGRLTAVAGKKRPQATAADRPAVKMLPDRMRVNDACTWLRSEPGITAIGERLRVDRLLVSAGRLRAVRWVTVAVIAAVFVLGVLRLIEGTSNHRPTGDLQSLFALSIIVDVFVLVFMLRPASTRMSTRRASSLVRRLRTAHSRRTFRSAAPGAVLATGRGRPAAREAAGAAPAQDVFAASGLVLLGVALWGFDAVPDQAISGALLAGMAVVRSSGNRAGYAGTSYVGCGGGGCGGGGGGCGGGGGGCGG